MRWVSHLPQLAATALAAALADAGVPAGALGPGGRDTTRLAVSPWRLWHALLAMSPSASAYPIRLLEAELTSMRRALEAGDLDGLGRTWRRAAAWRSGELSGSAVELGPVKAIRGTRKPKAKAKARTKATRKVAAAARSQPEAAKRKAVRGRATGAAKRRTR